MGGFVMLNKMPPHASKRSQHELKDLSQFRPLQHLASLVNKQAILGQLAPEEATEDCTRLGEAVLERSSYAQLRRLRFGGTAMGWRFDMLQRRCQADSPKVSAGAIDHR